MTGVLAVLALAFAGLLAAPALAAPSVGFGWGGLGGWGQLGDGKYGPSPIPARIANLENVVSVSVGSGADGLALLANGTVWGWGRNSGEGDLLLSSKSVSTVPVQVPGLSEVTAVATDGFTGLALLRDGAVMEWGIRPNGNEVQKKPEAVGGLSGVVAISAGAGLRLALLSNGTVMAWGTNRFGQLGDGTTTASETPVQVHGLSEVTAVAAAQGEFALALLADGEVRAWGRNEEGALGAACGGCEDSTLPLAVEGVSHATAISGGHGSGYALLSGGEVAAWGGNGIGQLGDGNTKRVTGPVTVTGLSGVTAIAAGNEFSLALLEGGNVVAWGGNVTGELGNNKEPGSSGSSIFSPSPVPVCGLEDVSGIDAGFDTAFAWGPAGEGCKDELSIRPLAEFGRCLRVAAGTGREVPGCSLTGELEGLGSFEWYPASGGTKPLEKSGLTLAGRTGLELETAHGTKISCSGAAGEGEYTGVTSVAVGTLVLTGCKEAKGGSCSSAGAGAGEVQLPALDGQLSQYSVEKSLDTAEGVELSPPAGEAFAEFTCAGVPVTVQGSLIAQVKIVNETIKTNTWILAETKGVQNPVEFTGAPEARLTAKVGAGSDESAGVKAKLSVANAEAVEVR
ncbi:MAG TPA: hypothetical protein VGY13_06030 [Solirubrobacteraceae bacterium]|nr:hypothetical protein [Solirubrobacteraceae bacterium]